MTVKPFLKWQGGKSRLLEHIDEAFGGHCQNYFEPMIGGGAVFFHRQSAGLIKGHSYLADINWKLITTYKAVRDYPAELLEELRGLSRFNGLPGAYYEARNEFNSLSLKDSNSKDGIIKIAGLFIYLNKNCFNGLYRENKQGKFNVPIGSYKTVNLPSEEQIMTCSGCLQDTTLSAESALYTPELSAHRQTSSHVYLDPPYVPLSTTASFTDYNAEGFGWNEQVALSNLAEVFAKRFGSRVVISNHGTNLVKSELYPSPPFEHFKEIPLKRTGGAKKTGLEATELIVRIG